MREQVVKGILAKVPDGYIKPEGVLVITKNGRYDVSGYSKVIINVASGDVGEELTQEQINAINNIVITLGDELIIEYDETILDLNFSIVNGELLIENNIEGLSFNINNKELEVMYL